MNKAVCLVRDPPDYRRDAFLAGLRKAGFDIVPHLHQPRPGDLLVIWNRYGQGDQEAKKFEAAGAAVIVAENGYLGAGAMDAKAVDRNGQRIYAMALWHHNGAGEWPVGAPGRWREQGIEVQPWRMDGEHVLVLPQRGIGPPGVAMPQDWPDKTMRRLKAMTDRPIKVRSHPGNMPARTPLSSDLKNAWCAVVWASTAGLKAICAGVPVFTDFMEWIGRPGAFLLGTDIEHPHRHNGDRELMLDRLAWAQWSVSGISSGEPFLRLMDHYRQKREAA